MSKNTIFAIAVRECRRMTSRPLYLFCMMIAPALVFIFFTTMMSDGLPTGIPAAVVDEDNTSVTRQIIRNLDAFQQTKIIAYYNSFAEAREAMQRGEIYAFYYIPKGCTEQALASRQPVVSFYTAASYIIPASLEYRDMKMMSEYASGAVTRATLYAQGLTEQQAMAVLQPITIEMHPLNNPRLNYSVYLCNTMLPGILMLLILQVTIFSIYGEIKEETAAEWLSLSNNNIIKALTGKLLPQFIIWLIMTLLYMMIMYGYYKFPLNCSFMAMLLPATLLILASQGLAIFICAMVPSLRWALSLATLWGVLSFPISGFSFPYMAFPSSMKALSYLFPLRHYFMIYASQALNGLSWHYTWLNYALLLFFIILPLFVINRLKTFLLEYHYTI